MPATPDGAAFSEGCYGYLRCTEHGGQRAAAQSFALENISGNIANSQTRASSGSKTAFSDLILPPGRGAILAGSVNSLSRMTNNVQGQDRREPGLHPHGDQRRRLFRRAEGGGLFRHRRVFTGVNAFTRRGDFEVDRKRLSVNGANNYLLGMRLDVRTGQRGGLHARGWSVIGNDVVPAQATTSVEYRASLPSVADDRELRREQSGSDCWPRRFGPAVSRSPASPRRTRPPSSPAPCKAARSPSTDQQGVAADVQLRWAKVADGTGPANDTWALYYKSDSPAVGGNIWTQIPASAGSANFEFNASGQQVVPTGKSVDREPDGRQHRRRQRHARHRQHRPVAIFPRQRRRRRHQLGQNGFAPAGSPASRPRIGPRAAPPTPTAADRPLPGVRFATFKRRHIAAPRRRRHLPRDRRIRLADLFHQRPRGRQLARGVERRHLREFTKLIVTQQAYAANTRIVTTSNQMLQETINMIR